MGRSLPVRWRRYSSSDIRRQSARVNTLSKVMVREKQRRLAARNEVCALQRQLGKKLSQQQTVAVNRSALVRQHAKATQAAGELRTSCLEQKFSCTCKLKWQNIHSSECYPFQCSTTFDWMTASQLMRICKARCEKILYTTGLQFLASRKFLEELLRISVK